MRRVRRGSVEVLWLAICAGILGWKLLLPGFVGMADNGDFAKVAGPLCLASAENSRENFFHPVYERDARNCFDAGTRTSERAAAGLASGIEQVFGDRRRFDIRWLGAIHAFIFLAFFRALLRLLEPLGKVSRLVLPLPALWIFADIGLVAYFNSFYTDTAAALGVLAAVVTGVHLLANKRTTPALLVVFGAAATVAATSKVQHALAGPVAAALVLAIAWRATDRPTRITAGLLGMILLAATGWIVAGTPSWYKAQAKFNVIFLKIAKNSDSPAQDLAELGLGADDARYIGSNAFVPGGPMENAEWVRQFAARCTDGKMIRYYLTHPGRAAEILRDDLYHTAWQRRDPEQANFTRASGREEGTLAMSLGSYSAFRTWIARKWPGSVALWMAAWPVAAFLFSRGKIFRRAIAWTVFAVAAAALLEFAIASLSDALETPRHLLLFHIYSDLCIFLGLVYLADVLEAIWPRFLRRVGAAAAVAGVAIFVFLVGRYELPADPLPRRAAEALPAGAVDDTSPAVRYGGNWASGAFGSAFQGTLTYSNQPGAMARYSFEGTELQYVYTKAPNRGMALVTIDGRLRREVDLYGPQIVWQVREVFGGLSAGRHEVEVQVLGRHNADSAGNFVDVDAFASR